MWQFDVWAPTAEVVEVEVGTCRTRMTLNADGWRTVRVECATPASDYRYYVDGRGPFPDPRSGWQPNGVHGASRVVDLHSFDWNDHGFQAKPLSAAVIYELHVGTFTPEGTFEAIIDKLEHLRSLGVTHVELMPVAEFPGERGWGYDGAALYAPRHAYGGPMGLMRLVDACHRHGLAVILDVVYNHLGPSGNYLPQFGPYFSERHKTPWGSALNFDGPYSDGVRRFFCDNALMWLQDYHLDGLRLDAIHAIVDTSAIPFLEQLSTEVDELKAHLGRHLVLIAESDLNDPRVVRVWEMGGFGIDAQWSDDFHHALHTVLTGENEGYYRDFGSLTDLTDAFKHSFIYAGRRSEFRQRIHGRPPIGISGHCFVSYLQNHDQLGNRAQGDRLCSLVSVDRVKIGAALVLVAPFVPLLFQGEEWGASSPFQYFVDFADEPNLARAVSEGRQKEFAAFGWKREDIPDPQSPETFQRSKLNWEEIPEDKHADLLSWHRQLIRLRRALPSLTNGRLDLVQACCDEAKKWFVVERGPVSVLCNFSEHSQLIPVRAGLPRHVLLASHAPCNECEEGLCLPAESVAIIGPVLAEPRQ